MAYIFRIFHHPFPEPKLPSWQFTLASVLQFDFSLISIIYSGKLYLEMCPDCTLLNLVVALKNRLNSSIAREIMHNLHNDAIFRSKIHIDLICF